MSWTFEPNKIAKIRGRAEGWNVQETCSSRPATCRACGEEIRAGEERLSFQIRGRKAWGEVFAHIHRQPCTPDVPLEPSTFTKKKAKDAVRKMAEKVYEVNETMGDGTRTRQLRHYSVLDCEVMTAFIDSVPSTGAWWKLDLRDTQHFTTIQPEALARELDRPVLTIRKSMAKLENDGLLIPRADGNYHVGVDALENIEANKTSEAEHAQRRRDYWHKRYEAKKKSQALAA